MTEPLPRADAEPDGPGPAVPDLTGDGPAWRAPAGLGPLLTGVPARPRPGRSDAAAAAGWVRRSPTARRRDAARWLTDATAGAVLVAALLQAGTFDAALSGHRAALLGAIGAAVLLRRQAQIGWGIRQAHRYDAYLLTDEVLVVSSARKFTRGCAAVPYGRLVEVSVNGGLWTRWFGLRHVNVRAVDGHNLVVTTDLPDRAAELHRHLTDLSRAQAVQP